MTCVCYFCLSQVFLSWLFDSRNLAVVFSDKHNFCISFSLPSLVIYLPLPLFWWLMLSSLEVNGNRRHNHIYKDTEHNSLSEGLRGLFCFSTTILSLSLWLFSLWPYLNSEISIPPAKLDQISLLSGVFKGMFLSPCLSGECRLIQCRCAQLLAPLICPNSL